jgi:AAHS family 3-hydroxyphenylpropionic acid transporter
MPSSPLSESALSRRTIWLCAMVAVLEGFDLQAAGVAAPKLVPAMGLDPSVLGWFFSASTIGMFFGAYAGGWLSDRMGRKTVLLISIVLFGLCSILTGLAQDETQLIAARLLTGIGLGGALPNLIALVSENSAPDRKGRAVAMMYCGTPIGGAIASVAALYSKDWEFIFHLGGVLPLLFVPILVWLLPSSRGQAVGAAAPARLGVATALFGGGRAARTTLLWSAFFTTLLVLYLLLNWTPSLLTTKGFDRGAITLFQMVFNLAGGVACLIAAAWLDGRKALWIGAAAFGAIILFLGLMTVMPAQVGLVVFIAAGLGFGVLVAQALLYGLASKLYDVAYRGAGAGASVSVGRLGSAVGPLLAGVVLTAGLSPDQLLLSIIPVAVVGAICALVLQARVRE